MPANHSNTNRVITILIHFAKTCFENVFVMLLRRVARSVTSSLLSWHKRYDFLPQIFDVIAHENARYKRNEIELSITVNSHNLVTSHLSHVILLLIINRL